MTRSGTQMVSPSNMPPRMAATRFNPYAAV
jgi:hypothetical protein